MVLETSQDEEYQLTCAAVKEGENVQETLWDTVDFLIINSNNTCFFQKLVYAVQNDSCLRKVVFNQVVYAKSNKRCFAMQVVLR